MTKTSPPTIDPAQAEAQERERARAEALEKLAELRRARTDLDAGEVAAVAAARNLGLTYREMAPHLGMSHQHMQHYFAPLLRTTHVVTVEPAEVPAGKNARRRPRTTS